MRDKSLPGMFYRSSPGSDFRGMTQLMKAYIERRGQWIDRTLLADAGFPVAPVIAPGNVDLSAPSINVRLSSAPAAGKVKWRLAEIPRAKLKPGHSYRIRARAQDDEGRWSHWSAPQQVTPR